MVKGAVVKKQVVEGWSIAVVDGWRSRTIHEVMRVCCIVKYRVVTFCDIRLPRSKLERLTGSVKAAPVVVELIEDDTEWGDDTAPRPPCSPYCEDEVMVRTRVIPEYIRCVMVKHVWPYRINLTLPSLTVKRSCLSILSILSI